MLLMIDYFNNNCYNISAEGGFMEKDEKKDSYFVQRIQYFQRLKEMYREMDEKIIVEERRKFEESLKDEETMRKLRLKYWDERESKQTKESKKNNESTESTSETIYDKLDEQIELYKALEEAFAFLRQKEELKEEHKIKEKTKFK